MTGPDRTNSRMSIYTALAALLGWAFAATVGSKARAGAHQACREIDRMARQDAADGKLEAAIVERGADLGEWGLVCLDLYLPDDRYDRIRELIRARLAVRRAAESGSANTVYLGAQPVAEGVDAVAVRSREIALAATAAISRNVVGSWTFTSVKTDVQSDHEQDLSEGFTLAPGGGQRIVSAADLRIPIKLPDGRDQSGQRAWSDAKYPAFGTTPPRRGRMVTDDEQKIVLPLAPSPTSLTSDRKVYQQFRSLVPERELMAISTVYSDSTQVVLDVHHVPSFQRNEALSTVTVRLSDPPTRSGWWGMHRIAYRAQTPAGIAFESLALAGGLVALLSYRSFQEQVGVVPVANQKRMIATNLTAGTLGLIGVGGTATIWFSGKGR